MPLEKRSRNYDPHDPQRQMRWKPPSLPLYAASLTDGLGAMLIGAYLPLYVYQDLGETRLRVISLLFALPSAVVFVANHFWGARADQKGRLKGVLITGLVGYGLLLVTLSLLHNVWAIIAAVTAGSALYAAVAPTMKTWATLDTAGASGAGGTGEAVGDVLRFQAWGWFVGGLLTGYLLDRLGMSMSTLLVAGAVWTWGVVVWAYRNLPEGIKPRRRHGAATEPPAGRSLAAAFRAAWRELARTVRAVYGRPELLLLQVTIFLLAMANETFFSVSAIFFTEFLGGSTTLYGMSLGLTTLLGALVFGLVGRFVDRHGSTRGLKVAFAGYAACYLSIALVPNEWVVALAFALPIFPILVVSATATVSQLTHASERGGGLGSMDAMFALAIFGGGLAGGAVGDALGLRFVPVLSVALVAAGGASLLLLIRRFGHGQSLGANRIAGDTPVACEGVRH